MSQENRADTAAPNKPEPKLTSASIPRGFQEFACIGHSAHLESNVRPMRILRTLWGAADESRRTPRRHVGTNYAVVIAVWHLNHGKRHHLPQPGIRYWWVAL